MINTWHAVLGKYCEFLSTAQEGPQSPFFQSGHEDFIASFALVLMQLPAGTLALLASKGGVRITKMELLHMAARGVLQSTIGKSDPTHLTCREMFLLNYVAVQFTADFPDHVLEAWLMMECPQFPWASFQDDTRGLAANTARALLGFMQITLEDHLTPRMGPMTYIPKPQASALWEHMEAGIRSIAPCIVCALRGDTQLHCSPMEPACLHP